MGRGREGGDGGLPQSAFTKPADLTFVRPGPAVRCQALLCDWSLCAVDLGSVLVSCDWLLISPQLPVRPDEVLSPSGSRRPPPSRCTSEMIRFQQEYLRHESGNYPHPTALKAVHSHCLTVVKRQSRPPRAWKQERVVTRCKCWRGNPC